MTETLTVVRFCDTCGMRTSHDGDKCLVCALPATKTPQETKDVGTSDEPSGAI